MCKNEYSMEQQYLKDFNLKTFFFHFAMLCCICDAIKLWKILKCFSNPSTPSLTFLITNECLQMRLKIVAVINLCNKLALI